MDKPHTPYTHTHYILVSRAMRPSVSLARISALYSSGADWNLDSAMNFPKWMRLESAWEGEAGKCELYSRAPPLWALTYPPGRVDLLIDEQNK